MTNPIVTTNVTQTIAPAPSTFQQTGAIISQGGTTLPAGTYSLLVQPNSLTPLLIAPLSLSSLAWVAGVVTATTTAPHNLAVGDTFVTTIAGAVPAAYNGTYFATVTGASAFTYALATNPGVETAPGTYTERNVGELVAMANSFFGQGNLISVYVLELGAGEPAAGVTALSNFITNNPGFFYAYLVPRSWDAVPSYLTFVATFEATTAKTYFYTTTTVANFASYTNLMKCVYWLVEAPGVPPTEFSAAGPFYDLVSQAPSATNKVSPFEFIFQFGLTPWPVRGNGVTLTNIKNAGGNYVGTGAEGGISNALIVGGQYADKKPVNFWYAADWIQVNCDLAASNAVINGSNNPINPLYFNQQGIDRVQQVVASEANDGVTFGMVLNPVIQTELDGPALAVALDQGTFDHNTIINAIPFVPYTTANPGDYSIGNYAGISVTVTPLRGFDRLTFNINVSSFA